MNQVLATSESLLYVGHEGYFCIYSVSPSKSHLDLLAPPESTSSLKDQGRMIKSLHGKDHMCLRSI